MPVILSRFRVICKQRFFYCHPCVSVLVSHHGFRHHRHKSLLPLLLRLPRFPFMLVINATNAHRLTISRVLNKPPRGFLTAPLAHGVVFVVHGGYTLTVRAPLQPASFFLSPQRDASPV